MGFFDKLLSALQPKRTPDDAQRLARLLIAEIKLSEPYKLERGIQQRDICGSLATEITEARKKFVLHCPQSEHAHLFDEQLIDVLADGDRAKLGAAFFFRATE